MANSIIKVDQIQANTAAYQTFASPIGAMTSYPQALLATPTAGTFEYDGVTFYSTPNALNRGVDAVLHYQALLAANSVANDNSVHAIFNGTANGTITLPANTAYELEMQFHVSTTGTTARTLGLVFAFSNAPTAISYSALTTAPATDILSATSQIWSVVATATQVTGSVSSASYSTVFVKGIIRTNLATTLIPQLQWSAAPGATSSVFAGSYIKLMPLGTSAVVSVGNWS